MAALLFRNGSNINKLRRVKTPIHEYMSLFFYVMRVSSLVQA